MTALLCGLGITYLLASVTLALVVGARLRAVGEIADSLQRERFYGSIHAAEVVRGHRALRLACNGDGELMQSYFDQVDAFGEDK